MSFGATCSPYCAQYVKNRNAKDYMHEYPEAANAIIRNHYVDDYIDSFDSEVEALRVSKAVIKVHKYGGFEIRNFRSNSEVVMKELEFHASQEQPHVAMADAEKVLGLWWSPKTDEFFFKFDKNNVKDESYIGIKKPTKRQVLRFLMQIYDPLGLVANVLINLKILLQNIWRSGIEWDEEIKDEHFLLWKKWLRLLPTIREVKIPRTYFVGFNLTSTSEVELYIFCEEAYATVAYLRVQNQGSAHCCLISSKTKVAPLRPLSIPRMELEAALLGTRLATSIIESHTINFKRHVYWTDSKTVIFWINGKTRKCKQFLATRVGEILERTNANLWRWLPSKLNAADEATRPRANLESCSMNRWYNGPEFLWQPEEHWPQTNFIKNPDTIEVIEQLHHSILQTIPIIDVTRYSRWRRLLNVVSKVYEFIEKILRDRSICNQLSFTDKAESYLFRQAQSEIFSEDIVTLKASKEISNSSPLYKLTPYLDSDGVLRIQGRIDACTGVNFDTKRPIVLPRHHHVTHLIVDHYHRKYHHQYNEIVVNEIRQRFYISHLRVLMKRIQKQCQRCSNMKAKPVVPLMGELPPSRLKTFTRPFSYIGIDYFGPMSVAVGRRREKRWGVLITCLTVRAIHIEIAHTLSTDSCILALQKFTARRGLPIHIYSDNGTNFRGASKELRSAVERIDDRKLIENVGEGKLKWTFIPPAAPHMGGSWERLVRSVKQTLATIMPTQNPRDEVLLTMMSEVENILNSRPLTYVPITGQEDEALTPNHFLLGSSSGAKPIGECCDDGSILKRNWLLTQQFGNSFWRRWIQEYLPDLTKRTKWFQNSKAIQTDDIVIVVDGNSPRNTWPRGRIIRTITGSDGLVRSAVVQTSSGVYVRPASKLAVLDVVGSCGFAKPEAPPNSSDLPGETVDEPGSTGQPAM